MTLKDLVEKMTDGNAVHVTFQNDVFHIFTVRKHEGKIECTFDREMENLDKEIDWFTVMKDKTILVQLND